MALPQTKLKVFGSMLMNSPECNACIEEKGHPNLMQLNCGAIRQSPEIFRFALILCKSCETM